MFTIKVWCLPSHIGEEWLQRIQGGLVEACSRIPVLQINDEKQMLVLFPTDRMEYGLGSEIWVEVCGFFANADAIDKGTYDKIARKLGNLILNSGIGEAHIESTVHFINSSKFAHWSSTR